jgi:hypothetical protein
VALRVLKQVGFSLDHNTYYNIHSCAISIEQNEFVGLIATLKGAGFLFKCYAEEEIDPNIDARVVLNVRLTPT